ncbi:separin protein [Mycoemilia scoparia]|uniref:separase n=1 Tax=Mycoemilia scoparia TaxID=417184 RepID=A0A9W8A554_9FUNG|nr:separin protein [Mycoemilia scoparia]
MNASAILLALSAPGGSKDEAYQAITDTLAPVLRIKNEQKPTASKIKSATNETSLQQVQLAKALSVKVLNFTNQKLSKNIKQIKLKIHHCKNKEKIDEVTNEYIKLIDSSVLAIKCLLKYSSTLQLPPLSLEMSISNFVNHCVEIKLGYKVYDIALKLKNKIYNSKRTEETSNGNCGSKTKIPTKTTTLNVSRSKSSRSIKPTASSDIDEIASKVSSMNVGNPEELDPLLVPIKYFTADTRFSTLVIRILINILRIIAHSNDKNLIQKHAKSLADEKDSAYAWCLKLMEMDEDSGKACMQANFLTLFSCANLVEKDALSIYILSFKSYLTGTERSPVKVIKYMNDISAYYQNKLNENLAGPSELCAFYKGVFAILKEYLKDLQLYSLTHLLQKHFYSTASKDDKLKEATAYTERLLKYVINKFSDEHEIDLAILQHKLLIFSANIDNFSKVPCANDVFSSIRTTQKYLETFVEKQPKLSEGCPYIQEYLNIYIQTWKSLYIFVSDRLRLIDQGKDRTDTGVFIEFEAVVTTIIDVIYITALKDVTSNKEIEARKPYLSSIADLVSVQMLLLRLLRMSKPEMSELAFERLRAANRLYTKYSFARDKLHNLSTYFFNYGIDQYQSEMYFDAVIFMSESVKLIELAACSNGDSPPDDQQRKDISKRYEIIGVCYERMMNPSMSASAFSKAAEFTYSSDIGIFGHDAAATDKLANNIIIESKSWSKSKESERLSLMIERYCQSARRFLNSTNSDVLVYKYEKSSIAPGSSNWRRLQALNQIKFIPGLKESYAPNSVDDIGIKKGDLVYTSITDLCKAFANITPVQKALIMEIEALNLSGHENSIHPRYGLLVKCLNIYNKKYPARRARCLSEISKLLYDQNNTAYARDLVEEALELISSIHSPNTSNAYYRLLLSKLHAWKAIMNTDLEPLEFESINKSIELLESIVSDNGSNDPLWNSTQFWITIATEISYIAGFLRNNGLIGIEARFLRAISSLAPQSNDTDLLKLRFNISIQLSVALSDLGHKEAATYCLDEAFSHQDIRTFSPKDQQIGTIVKALTQLLSGSLDKSRELLVEAGEIIEKENINNGMSRKSTIEPLVLILASYAHAQLALKDGMIPEAVEIAIHGYRLICSVINSIAIKLKSETPAEKVNNADPFTEPVKSSREVKTSQNTDGLQFESLNSGAYWEYQYWIFKFLLVLVEIYKIRGSTMEAEYFTNHIMSMSRKCPSSTKKRVALTTQIDLYSRQHDWDRTLLALDELNGLPEVEWPDVNGLSTTILEFLKLARASWLYGDNGQATHYLASASKLLQKVEKAEYPFNNSSGGTMKIDESLMELLRINVCQFGKIAGLEDSIDAGALQINKLSMQDLPLCVTKEQLSEVFATTAKLKYQEIKQLIEKDPVCSLASKSVLLYPSFRKSKQLRPRKSSAKGDIKSALSDLEQFLVLAIEIVLIAGSSNAVHETVNLLATVRGLQVTLGFTPTSPQIVDSIANGIESAKHVAILREMVEALRNAENPLPSDITSWPGKLHSSKKISKIDSPSASPSRYREQRTPRPTIRKNGAYSSPMLSLASSPNDLVSSMLSLSLGPDNHGSPLDLYNISPPHEPLSQIDFEAFPEKWVIVGISADLFVNSLFITRYQKGIAPCVVQLPLPTSTMNTKNKPTNILECDSDQMSYTDALAELEDIIKCSDDTMKSGKDCETRAQKEEWWSTRKRIDERLKKLLNKIEDDWLGDFKGLFSYTQDISDGDLQEFCDEIHHLVSTEVIPKSQLSKCKGLELDPSLSRLLLNLSSLADFDTTDLLDTCHFILDAYMYQNVEIHHDKIDTKKMGAMLRTLINKYKERAKSRKGEHFILLVDKYCQQIPWESINVLRDKPASRLPSMPFLADRINRMRSNRYSNTQRTVVRRGSSNGVASPSARLSHSSSLTFGTPEYNTAALIKKSSSSPHNVDGVVVDSSSLYYILNPEGDLSRTQSAFEGFLREEPRWKGSIGRPPMSAECENALSNHDIFLYFGHGGAEHYIKKRQVRQLSQCAVSLLLGCSSGYLKPAGEFDSTGTAINYLIGKCPTLVANLWDVGDKDIDRFSVEMLKRWQLMDPNKDLGKPGSKTSLVEAVSQSRGVCRMPYLTGAAPVIYGIPCYLA